MCVWGVGSMVLFSNFLASGGNVLVVSERDSWWGGVIPFSLLVFVLRNQTAEHHSIEINNWGLY
jgi:hypothetical protein